MYSKIERSSRLRKSEKVNQKRGEGENERERERVPVPQTDIVS